MLSLLQPQSQQQQAEGEREREWTGDYTLIHDIPSTDPSRCLPHDKRRPRRSRWNSRKQVNEWKRVPRLMLVTRTKRIDGEGVEEKKKKKKTGDDVPA